LALNSTLYRDCPSTRVWTHLYERAIPFRRCEPEYSRVAKQVRMSLSRRCQRIVTKSSER
jgi:hypothetical protein